MGLRLREQERFSMAAQQSHSKAKMREMVMSGVGEGRTANATSLTTFLEHCANLQYNKYLCFSMIKHNVAVFGHTRFAILFECFKDINIINFTMAKI